MKTTISVVIPCFNAAPFLADTLRSVMAQTRGVDEIVLVDDGSHDGSADVARSFGSRVTVIEQPNRGVSTARNVGIARAGGDVIALLDADDLWHPEKLDRQLRYLERHPDAGAVVTSVERFSDDPAVRSRFLAIDDETIRHATPADFLIHTWVNQSAVVIRAELARQAPYPAHTGDSEDMIQATELRLLAPIGAVPDALTFYRHHERQATRRSDHWYKSLHTRLTWAAEHYERLGYVSPTDAQSPILTHAAEQTLLHYWRRDVLRFKYERRELLAMWPGDLPVYPGLDRLVLPSFLLRMKDLVWK